MGGLALDQATKESAAKDGRSVPPITGGARGGTLADMTTAKNMIDQRRAQGDRSFPSGSTRTTRPSLQHSHATHVITATRTRGRPLDAMHEMNYKNPIKNMIPNDGAPTQKRGLGRLVAPVGATTAIAVWTANGRSG